MRLDFLSPESLGAATDGFDIGEVEGASGVVLSERDGERGPGVEDRDLTRDLSIHGFAGGNWGVVYCERAEMERSNRSGSQTPTRTRQAATRRFALLKANQFVLWKRARGTNCS